MTGIRARRTHWGSDAGNNHMSDQGRREWWYRLDLSHLEGGLSNCLNNSESLDSLHIAQCQLLFWSSLWQFGGGREGPRAALQPYEWGAASDSCEASTEK